MERRVFVDSGAAVSIIHNIQEPRKNRIFKVINVQRNYLSNWHKWSEIYWSDDEEEYDDNSVNKKHENVIPFDGNGLYKVLTSAEDLKKGKDASCSNSSSKNDSFHLSRNEYGSPTVKRPLNDTIPSGKEDKLKLEDSRNDIQSTEEDACVSKEHVEDNDNNESIKHDKISRSKVCIEHPSLVVNLGT